MGDEPILPENEKEFKSFYCPLCMARQVCIFEHVPPPQNEWLENMIEHYMLQHAKEYHPAFSKGEFMWAVKNNGERETYSQRAYDTAKRNIALKCGGYMKKYGMTAEDFEATTTSKNTIYYIRTALRKAKKYTPPKRVEKWRIRKVVPEK